MIAIASAIPARVPPTITLTGSPAPPFERPFPFPASASEVGGKLALEAEAEAAGESEEGVRVRVRVAEAVAVTDVDVDVLASPSDANVVCRATSVRGNIIVLPVKLQLRFKTRTLHALYTQAAFDIYIFQWGAGHHSPQHEAFVPHKAIAPSRHHDSQTAARPIWDSIGANPDIC